MEGQPGTEGAGPSTGTGVAPGGAAGSIGAHPGDDPLRGAERAVALSMLSIRLVHLLQGAICIATGWRRYRRPWLAAGILGAAAVESAVVGGRVLRAGRHGDAGVWVDNAFGTVGLVAMAASTHGRDRTTSLNWMLPYTVTSVAATAALDRPRVRYLGAVGLLGGTYVCSVAPAVGRGEAAASTAVANAASYAGFAAVLDVFGRFLRRAAIEAAEARELAVAGGKALAAEQERTRQYRLLHDSALQTLEVIATGVPLDDAAVRRQARRDATRLRALLRGAETGRRELVASLEELADAWAERGMHVDLVTAEVTADPPPAAVDAVVGAVGEAVTNAAKHAGADRVVVRARSTAGGIEVTVRDHGAGFDPARRVARYGVAESIDGRVAAVGGRTEHWSVPGRGTRVTVWVPA